MTDEDELTLPQIISYDDFKGDFSKFFNEVYEIFKKDFIESKPIYRGREVKLKKHPYVDGKEATFYHLTHEGITEDDRKPDLRRMERISWPRFLIDHSEHTYLKVWENERKGDKRILIWHTKEKYLFILSDRTKYVLPWTAYLVVQDHRISKLLKEYEKYKKTDPA